MCICVCMCAWWEQVNHLHFIHDFSEIDNLRSTISYSIGMNSSDRHSENNCEILNYQADESQCQKHIMKIHRASCMKILPLSNRKEMKNIDIPTFYSFCCNFFFRFWFFCKTRKYPIRKIKIYICFIRFQLLNGCKS